MQIIDIENGKIEKISIQDILKEEPIRISPNMTSKKTDQYAIKYIPINYHFDKETNAQNRLKVSELDSAETIERKLFLNENMENINSIRSNSVEGELGKIAYSISNISYAITDLARVERAKAYIIAKSILDMSYNLSSSIQQLVDEVERKNKLDEFYMMLNKIEEYEDKLIEWGCLEEVYENLRLIQYPTIQLDEKVKYLLLELDETILEKVIAKMSQQFKHPLKVLAEFLSNQYWWYSHKRIFLGNERNQLKELLVPEGFVKEISDKQYRFAVLFNDLYKGYSVTGNKCCLIKKGNLEVLGFGIKLEEPLKVALLWLEARYNSLSMRKISRIQFDERYFKLDNDINKINRDIQLTNLRCLYMSLRNAIREYKIKNALGENIDS